jgi:hypothetical protein
LGKLRSAVPNDPAYFLQPVSLGNSCLREKQAKNLTETPRWPIRVPAFWNRIQIREACQKSRYAREIAWAPRQDLETAKKSYMVTLPGKAALVFLEELHYRRQILIEAIPQSVEKRVWAGFGKFLQTRRKRPPSAPVSVRKERADHLLCNEFGVGDVLGLLSEYCKNS